MHGGHRRLRTCQRIIMNLFGIIALRKKHWPRSRIGAPLANSETCISVEVAAVTTELHRLRCCEVGQRFGQTRGNTCLQLDSSW